MYLFSFFEWAKNRYMFRPWNRLSLSLNFWHTRRYNTPTFNDFLYSQINLYSSKQTSSVCWTCKGNTTQYPGILLNMILRFYNFWMCNKNIILLQPSEGLLLNCAQIITQKFTFFFFVFSDIIWCKCLP